MSGNEAIALVVAVVAMVFAFCRFLDFITAMASMEPRDDSKAKESAWDDEL